MARKTLKQKLKSSNRELRGIVTLQHEIGRQAVTSQVKVMQSVAMAHGLLATLGEIEKVLIGAGVDVTTDPAYLEVQKVTRARAAQCTQALVGYGLTQDEINKRVTRGH